MIDTNSVYHFNSPLSIFPIGSDYADTRPYEGNLPVAYWSSLLSGNSTSRLAMERGLESISTVKFSVLDHTTPSIEEQERLVDLLGQKIRGGTIDIDPTMRQIIDDDFEDLLWI